MWAEVLGLLPWQMGELTIAELVDAHQALLDRSTPAAPAPDDH